MDEQLAYFLDLRLRLRGKPEAIALVDRCIRIVAAAATASAPELAALQAEVDALGAELHARFGPKAPVQVH